MTTRTRVKHATDDELLGWHETGAIHADDDPGIRLHAFWLHNTVEEQEDNPGIPSEGYYTARGWWVPV